jgi:hypothetical protein
MKISCALDVADEGSLTLDEIGKFFGVTRERVRQIEAKGLKLLRRLPVLREVKEAGFDPPGFDANDWTIEAEGNGGGGDAPKDADPEQEWVDNVWRIYERRSREQAQGLLPMRSVRAAADATNDVEPVAAAPQPKSTLTPRLQAIYSTYLRMAKMQRAKPRPMEVAKECGLFKAVSRSTSANVSTALHAIAKQGYDVPYLNEKLPSRKPVKIVEKPYKNRHKPAAKTVEKQAETKVEAPASSDVFLLTLLAKHADLKTQMEVLEKQRKALETLIVTSGGTLE